MRILPTLLATALCGFAQQTNESPTGNRTTPPTIRSVAPLGVARGATVEMNVEGFNLANASAVYFSEAGVKAKIVRIKELPDLPDIRLGSNGTPSTIDLGPLPPRNQVTLEIDVSPEAHVGPVSFRLLTPLGTSPEGKFLIEPYYGESPDQEPNDNADGAFESYLPSILVGTITRPGDADLYKINVRAGEEIVFEDSARLLGSALRPVISIYATDQSLVKEFGQDGSTDRAFAHKFEKAGSYYVRISDYQQGGSANHFYRIKTGKFPYAISAFPLGVQNGKSAQVEVKGFHLGDGRLTIAGKPAFEGDPMMRVRPQVKQSVAFNEIRLALGEAPEVPASGTNSSLAQAQVVTVPSTVNGKLTSASQYFRFKAAKGQKLVIDVMASRLGSDLDSQIEILDPKGKAIERATVRCVLETFVTLRDHDSASPGIRITSPTGFAVGDYMMIGTEIIRVEAMPRTPDDDFRFDAFGGQRIAYFDTTPEAHAIDSPAYKVQIHAPGAKFASNGLPLIRLSYRNDDGGAGYGKDSKLAFTAPADGEYIVHLRDVRGLANENLAYRLSVRQPAPDFRLTSSPRNPNIPVGGRIPLTVSALRLDGFDGPIEVSLENVPAGLKATKGTIMPGQNSTVLLLSADAGLKEAAPVQVVGQSGATRRIADADDQLKLVSTMPLPDIQMSSLTKEVTLEPGGTAEVKVAISRNNEYGGRVPVIVTNLPPGVRVLDVGLNGVLINETENERSFTLEALVSAEPIEQPIIVSGNVETRAGGQQTLYAGEPIRLKVVPRRQISSTAKAPAESASAAK